MTFSAKEALETYSKFEKEVVYSKRNVMTIDDVILSEEVYDKLDAEKLIYIVVDNVTDEVVAFSTREEAEAYQYGEKSEDQKVLDKVLEGPATDNLDTMKEAFEEARVEVKEVETKEGNRIFKVLLDEANEENGRQAGKILGKILAEVREIEKVTEKQAYRREVRGLTYHFVKMTLPENYRLTLRSKNSMNLNISRYDMDYTDVHGKRKTCSVYFANDGRELN